MKTRIEYLKTLSNEELKQEHERVLEELNIAREYEPDLVHDLQMELIDIESAIKLKEVS